LNQQPVTRKQLSSHERLIKGLTAIFCLVATFFSMMYGLILSTNFITQLNPLNPGVIYLASGICYGLVALLVVFLLLYAGKSMTQAFSGTKN